MRTRDWTTSLELRVAAHLGDQTAARALGLERLPAEEMSFEEWAWAFPRLGHDVATWAALQAARLALPTWEGHGGLDTHERALFTTALPRHAIDVAEQWLSEGPLPRSGLEAVAREVDAVWSVVDVFVYEASGDAETVERRGRALSALASVRAAIKVAAWTPELVVRTIEDPVEAEAQIAVGPALHVVEAFAHACNAVQIDAEQLRSDLLWRAKDRRR